MEIFMFNQIKNDNKTKIKDRKLKQILFKKGGYNLWGYVGTPQIFFKNTKKNFGNP